MLENSDQIITLLSAILTGGFLMLFIESQKLSASVIDRFQGIMKPFYHKLSNYMKFVSSFRSAIIIDTVKGDERIKGLKEDIDDFARLCVAYDLPTGYYGGKELEELCDRINNVWYLISNKKGYTNELISLDRHCASIVEDRARKYIIEVDRKYEDETLDLDFFAQVSGDFYRDLFAPVERMTYEYEHWQKKEKRYKILAFTSLVVTLVSMLLIILIPCLCPWFVISLTLMSSALLIWEVIALIRLDRLANTVCRA